jgi:hypothetical protein
MKWSESYKIGKETVKNSNLFNFNNFRAILSFFGLLCILSTGYDIIVTDPRKFYYLNNL